MTRVFLYELAIELGEHSNDLAAVATMLGIADAGPASTLDAQQVAQLRAHFGGVATGPPPPPLGAPGPAAGAGPVAPPSWGPPGMPTFQAVPAPPLGSPRPAELGPTPAVGPAEGERRWSKGQMAAIVGVAVAVLGLFALMVISIGPDSQRQAALDAREQELAAATTQWVPPPEASTTTGVPPVTAAPMPRAVPGGISAGGTQTDPGNKPPAPSDLTRFCSGVRGISTLEVAIIEVFLNGDIDKVRAAVANGRRNWDVGVEHMIAGASGRDRPLIESYRELYLAMFGSIEQAGSTLEVSEFLHANYTQAQIDVADPVNQTANAYCT